MIYFKVDVGYCGYYDVSSLKKLDEVTITDSNKYYGIGTTYSTSFPNGDKKVPDFQNYCHMSFGNDFYEMWFIPGVNAGYQLSSTNWIPWSGFMYPNLYNLFETNGTTGNNKCGVVVFKTLNLLVAAGGEALPSGIIYRINKDLSLTKLSSFYGCNLSGQDLNFGFITNYTKGMKLSDANCARLDASVNSTSSRPSQVILDNPFLDYIFASNPTPDLVIDNDPYQPGGGNDDGGGSGEGGIGGGGNFDENSDPIDFPELPTISASDTGFISLFNPSSAELKNLANYMWGDLFDLSTWKKIFADPMDAILGLSIVPVDVPNAGQGEIVVGNISTGISMTRAATQYIEVDCGTIDVKEYWGAYLDYAPYTKAELYLPYIGIHPVSIDDIMKEPVHIKYHVDILSGSCCAYVKCGSSIMYSFVGQCSSSIPITGNDWTNVINGALSIAASIGTMVATAQEATRPLATEARAVAGSSSVASLAVNYCKPSIEKSGAMAGTGGMLGVQSPYLIITRPRQALPSLQNRFTGYPSIMTLELSTLSGYTEIEYIHLEGIPCTKDELLEIEELLKGGVIF